MPDYTYHFSGPFMAVRYKYEESTRGVDGLLNIPRLLFITGYDAERACPFVEPISWKAAEALAPEAMKDLGDQLIKAANEKDK